MSPNTLLDRTPAGRWNPRVACGITLTLVFLCGAVVGALAMNFGHSHLHQPRFGTPEAKTIFLERMEKQLDLTPTQTAQIESILDDFGQYYRTVLTDGKSRILQILNEDQRKKFEQLLLQSQHP
jgi:hypothetical protein